MKSWIREIRPATGLVSGVALAAGVFHGNQSKTPVASAKTAHMPNCATLVPAYYYILIMLLYCSVRMVAADEQHWSFQPIRRPVPVPTSNTASALSPIDSFVQARLQAAGLEPSAEADRVTLIRRVTIDLIGLAPTPEEVQEFVSDSRPDAYEKLVDRLLASPHYGERWARTWLDLCHYGDSDGHLTDQLRPVAWRYRDWVVSELNANLPFDQFTIAQIAGDLVETSGDVPFEKAPRSGERSHVLGTGFLRQTLSNREGGADLEEYRVEQVVDRTSMVGTIWLGLTVGCARCHDHKYDPLTQQEFFQLYAFFNQADEVNIDAPLPHELEGYLQARPELDRRRAATIEPYRAGLSELQKRWEQKCLHAAQHPGQDYVWDRQWELLGLVWGRGQGEGQLEGTEIVKLAWERRTPRQQDDLLDYFLANGSIVDEKRFAELKLGELRDQLAALKKEFSKAIVTRAPVMQVAFTPRVTTIHDRGDFRSPADTVESQTPSWLPPLADGEPNAKSRLDLARWLVSPSNPLTARVTVNRMWQDFFGRGLVSTSNDFGIRGDPPSHPELLDWLADEFMRSGWNVKQLHRRIVTSTTYRQSSCPSSEATAIDPENRLLVRQSSMRIPAEAVRDLSLAASGLLITRIGGPSVFPPQHERVTMEAFGSNNWTTSEGNDRYRRGLYTFILRTSPFAQSITFDAPNPQFTCTRRDRSNTPLQALTLLNDPVFSEAASAFGRRIQMEAGDSDLDRIRFAWEIAVSRPPSAAEIQRLTAFLERLRRTKGAEYQKEDGVWTEIASVLLNLHEFITRD